MKIWTWLRRIFDHAFEPLSLAPRGNAVDARGPDAKSERPGEDVQPNDAILRAELIDQLVEEYDAVIIHTKVAGTSYRNDDGTSFQSYIKHLLDYEELSLIPDPDNAYDKDAIRVETREGNQIGYLNQRLASDVSHSFASGNSWRCFVWDVTGWQYPVQGVNIALVGRNVVHLARPKADRDFEKWLNALARQYETGWCYAKLIGLKILNEDGSDRRELLLNLEHRQQLSIKTDTDDHATASRVHLVDTESRILAIFAKSQSQQILAGVKAGYKWAAIFGKCTESDGSRFQAYIALLRTRSSDATIQRGVE